MNLYKSILITLGLLLTMAANAQRDPTYSPQAVTVAIVPAGTSNTLSAVIDCRKQANVALSFKTTATNATLRIGASVDGVNYTTNRYVLQVATEVPSTVITNLAVAGVGYLRLDHLLVTGTIAATNTVSYGLAAGTSK